MEPLRILTASEQAAAYLRGRLAAGVWSGLMPGGDKLAAELGIGRNTIETALQQLEDEGFLENQGRRRGRRIVQMEAEVRRGMRVAILPYEPIAMSGDNYLIEIQHQLNEVGLTAFLAAKSFLEMGMDVGKVEELVAGTKADAWVVQSGSGEVLEWFAAREEPAFALFGRRRSVAIAGTGPDKQEAISLAVRSLVSLGHRRIVLMTRTERRLPEPGAFERAFLSELTSHGISPGPYHLPHWESTVEGFHNCLDSLFAVSLPTAVIIDETQFFPAAQQFFSKRGLRVPEDVSLICNDRAPDYFWCNPSVAHIRWETQPVVRRIVKWAANISMGKTDRRQTFTKANFIEGGTMGPVKRGV